MQMLNLPVCIEACALWLGPATSREKDHAKLLQNGSLSERGTRAPEDGYFVSKNWPLAPIAYFIQTQTTT